jgi:hypothetical protein
MKIISPLVSILQPLGRVGLLVSLSLPGWCLGDDPGTLLLEDRFERNESQEVVDEPGNGWNTNSKSRAKGNKQVDLRDGAMRIYLHPEADHAVSVTHAAEFADGVVSLRFMFEDAEDELGLNFADLQCREVHAGHLAVAKIGTRECVLIDLKTGNMRLDIRKAREAKQELSLEQKQALEGKQQKFSLSLAPGRWHEVQATIVGDELSLRVNGQAVGSFRSPGIAHPTKRMLRLAVPHHVVVDDVKISRLR